VRKNWQCAEGGEEGQPYTLRSPAVEGVVSKPVGYLHSKTKNASIVYKIKKILGEKTNTQIGLRKKKREER